VRLAFARRFFLQDLDCARFAIATARCHTQTILQLLKVSGAKLSRLANFPIGNRIANTNVHVFS
jgi:hypothetical protein